LDFVGKYRNEKSFICLKINNLYRYSKIYFQ